MNKDSRLRRAASRMGVLALLGLLLAPFSSWAQGACPSGVGIERAESGALIANLEPVGTRGDATLFDITVSNSMHAWYGFQWISDPTVGCLRNAPIRGGRWLINSGWPVDMGLVAPNGNFLLREVPLRPGDEFAICYYGPSRAGGLDIRNVNVAITTVFDIASAILLGEPLVASVHDVRIEPETFIAVINELVGQLDVDAVSIVWNIAQGIFDPALSLLDMGEIAVDLVLAVKSSRLALKSLLLEFMRRFGREGAVVAADKAMTILGRIAAFVGFVMNTNDTYQYAKRIRDALAQDSAGYLHIAAVGQAEDQTPPAGAFLTPLPGTIVGNRFTVTGTARDDCSGVDRVELFWTPDDWRTVNHVGGDRAPPYVFEVDLSGVADGTQVRLGWDIWDRANNQARSPEGNLFLTKNAAALLQPGNHLTVRSAVEVVGVPRPGAQVNARWTVENTGRLAWGAGQVVRLNEGDPLAAVAEVVLPPLRPGERGVVTFPLRVPAEAGFYAAELRAFAGAQAFGDSLIVGFETLSECPGGCPDGQDCVHGICQNACAPNCVNRTCGQDGCGGVCGVCAGVSVCENNRCIVPGQLTLTVSLALPANAQVGEPIAGSFTVRNDTAQAIRLDRLTIGGRGPGGDLDIRDFPHVRDLTINPGATYRYAAEYTPVGAGSHRFFVAYQHNGDWREPTVLAGVVRERRVEVAQPEAADWLVESFCIAGPQGCANQFAAGTAVGGRVEISGLNPVPTTVRFIYVHTATNAIIRTRSFDVVPNGGEVTVVEARQALPQQGAYRLGIDVNNGNGRTPYGPVVTFAYGEVGFEEGRAYKGADRPNVCYFTGGRCYLLESEPIYYHLFPDDPHFARVVEIDQATYDQIERTGPCVVGAPYDSQVEPGCILHDTLLEGDAEYFVSLVGVARRMNETAARSCFDPNRIFASRGIAWARTSAGALFFSFADTPQAPHYCDPGQPARALDCGDCESRTESCSRNTCRITRSACESQCAADEICDSDVCEPVQRLIAGRIVAPADGAVVSNAGFTVRWERGSASNGAGTGTGLYCRVNGGAWDLRGGFGDQTERGMPDYAPGTRIECKVRTRLNSDYATWVDSAVVGWTASDASAQMRILGITLEDDPGRDACDIVRFTARIRNEGVEEEGWEARVFLHQAGGSPEDADAVEGERWFTVVVAPGREDDFSMFIDPALPIPVGVGLEMTLRLADEVRGLGEPVQMTIPLEGVDVAPPVIERFDVYGVGGEPEGLIAGRSQEISLQVRDEYQLDDVQVEWRAQGGAWAPVQLETARRVCERSYFTAGSFDLPGNLAAGTLLEVRLRVVDLAGHVTERVLPAQVRVPNAPVVRFVTPVGGERYRRSFADQIECVQTRFFVSSPIPIRTLSFGLGLESARDLPTNSNRGILTNSTAVNPIPADGWVEGCVRTNTRGDNIRVVVRVYDENLENHYFVSPPITINELKPPAPWGELQLEPSQRRRPLLPDGTRPGLSFGDARLEAGRLVMYRYDSEPYNEFQPVEDPIQELQWISRLEFDPVDFRLISSTPILTRYERRSHPTFNAGLEWQGFGNEFQAFSHQKDDPDCENYQAPCDFTLATRRLSQGQVGPVAIVDRYPGIQGAGPGAREVLSMADGAQLLHMNLHRNAGATSSLYRRAGGEWSQLSAYQFSIHALHRVGNEAWAFRLETEADRHVVRRRTLNPQTGAVAATEDLVAFPRTQSWLMSTAVMQLTGALHFVAADQTNRHLWVGAHDGQRWTVGPQRTLPLVWRGQPVDAVHIRPLIEAGPWVEVQLPLARGAVNFLMPVAPGNAPDFDRMFERIDSLQPAVMPNGRLLRVVTLDWNYEPRLFFQPALANAGCYDANPCTTDDWDAVAGRCVHAAIECAQDGDACNGIEVCNPATGQCGPGEAVVCDDGQACNGVEGCDPASGACVAGVPVVADDGVACTVDACDPQTGMLVNTPSDERCVPSACAVAACRPGAPGADASGCVEEARVVADDGLACTVGRCDPATGRVVHEPVGACLIGGVCVAAGAANPQNACEICNPADPLRWSAAEVACDDGRFCTVDDRCVNRVCVGVARDCSGLIEDPACQRAPCDEAGDRCRVEALVDGAPCEDGDLCNGRETCRAGRCTAEDVPPLVSENPCIAFECDPVVGVQAVEVDAACDADADPCTVGDRCVEGECVAGGPLDCSGRDAGCARGRCVVENGVGVCAAEPIAEGDVCNDAQACTRADRCAAGVCRGEVFDCPPAGICERPESGACDGEGGCAYDPVDDGSPCLGGACDTGRCVVEGDECREPIALVGGGRLVLELSHATASAVAPACAPGPAEADVWLRFAAQPGQAYAIHVRSLGGTRLAAEVTDACPAGAPCLDGLEVEADEEAVLGPLRVAAPSIRLVRLQGLCCDAPRAEVWLEVQPDVAPCPDGSDGCSCRGDGTCDGPLVCQAGVCGEPICPMGSAGCDCRGGVCDGELVCEEGTCRAAPGCAPGSLGCDCRGNGTCDGSLACEAGLCVEAMACDQGAEGCACYGNGTCNAGLRCADDLCLACPSGSLGCGCYGNGTCDDGLRCAGEACVACPPGSDGCACYGNGTCDEGLVCGDGRCATRPPVDAGVRDAGPSADRGVIDDLGVDRGGMPGPDAREPDMVLPNDAAAQADAADPPGRADDGCIVTPTGGGRLPVWPLIGLVGALGLNRRRRPGR